MTKQEYESKLKVLLDKLSATHILSRQRSIISEQIAQLHRKAQNEHII